MFTYFIVGFVSQLFLGNSQLIPITGSDLVNDTLFGNASDNIISGRQGKDTLNGGNGNDWFTFIVNDLDNNIDIITDFNTIEDKIFLINSPPNVGLFECDVIEGLTKLIYNSNIIGQITDEVINIDVVISTDTGLVDTNVKCITRAPSTSPSLSPTNEPTNEPTVEPTHGPSLTPSVSPTSEPTMEPTTSPSNNPTISPSLSPTMEPTAAPSITPTLVTIAPSLGEVVPTQFPTCAPLIRQSVQFTGQKLECTPTTTFTSNPTIIGCDGIFIDADGVTQLICLGGLGSCNRSEIVVDPPTGDQITIDFEPFSFTKGVITASNVAKATCGERACDQSILNYNCDPEEPCETFCEGAYACLNAQINLQNGDFLQCIKEFSCFGSTFNFNRDMTVFSGVLLNCDGASSCQHTRIKNANGLNTISCKETEACQDLLIEYKFNVPSIEISIKCDGESSCKGANVVFETETPLVSVTITIECDGTDSCVGFNIVVGAGISVDATAECAEPEFCADAFIGGTLFTNLAFNALPPNNGIPIDCENKKSYHFIIIISILAVSNIIFGIIIFMQYMKGKRPHITSNNEQISSEMVNLALKKTTTTNEAI